MGKSRAPTLDQAEELRLGPWTEVVGSFCGRNKGKLILQCTKKYEVEPDALGSSDVLARLKPSDKVGIVALDDGTFRIRRVDA